MPFGGKKYKNDSKVHALYNDSNFPRFSPLRRSRGEKKRGKIKLL